MEFIDFINNIKSDDKNNFEKYSKIRGIQTYKIIFESLKKEKEEITYSDVNAFVKYDKALKDFLYTYLGTLEEYIRNYIFENYEFKLIIEPVKESYKSFKDLPIVEKRKTSPLEITELYKRFSLTFGEIIKFVKKYEVDKFDLEKLEEVRKLRNKVMHHSPLLFDCNFESIKNETEKGIICLFDLLPKQYCIGLSKELKVNTDATKRNINSAYYKFLLSWEV